MPNHPNVWKHPHVWKITQVAFLPRAPDYPAMFLVRWSCEVEDCEEELLEVVEARET